MKNTALMFFLYRILSADKTCIYHNSRSVCTLDLLQFQTKQEQYCRRTVLLLFSPPTDIISHQFHLACLLLKTCQNFSLQCNAWKTSNFVKAVSSAQLESQKSSTYLGNVKRVNHRSNPLKKFSTQKQNHFEHNNRNSELIKLQWHLAAVMAQLISWVKLLFQVTGSWKLCTRISCPQKSAAHQPHITEIIHKSPVQC